MTFHTIMQSILVWPNKANCSSNGCPCCPSSVAVVVAVALSLLLLPPQPCLPARYVFLDTHTTYQNYLLCLGEFSKPVIVPLLVHMLLLCRGLVQNALTA